VYLPLERLKRLWKTPFCESFDSLLDADEKLKDFAAGSIIPNAVYSQEDPKATNGPGCHERKRI